VGNTTNYERKNAQKCIAAGFDCTLLIARNEKKRRALEKALYKNLAAALQEKVHALVPESFLRFLDQWQAKHASGEKTVRGYKVKTNFISDDPEEQKRKREALAKLMVESMKKE